MSGPWPAASRPSARASPTPWRSARMRHRRRAEGSAGAARRGVERHSTAHNQSSPRPAGVAPAPDGPPNILSGDVTLMDEVGVVAELTGARLWYLDDGAGRLTAYAS